MIGRTLLHYQIVETLGRGGMGVVYKAKDTHLERFVAIKVLPPEKVADAQRNLRFVQEAKAASALNHPNIVHIYDIAETEGIQFIAMEYVAGKTLDQLIGRKGLRLNETLKYAVQIADALARAHNVGIIHRDLKPSNIMVDEHGLVKVLDFGLAKLTEPATGEFGETATIRAPERPSTEEGTIVGTVAYMSPEQAEGKLVDARSDIFSFGSVLYEMVTASRAFHGDSKLSTLSAILKEDPKAVSSVVPDVPRDLEKIISHCLRKDPSRRFQHMDDLKTLLDDLKEESESGKLTAAAIPARGHRRTISWSAGALVIVGVTVLALWFARSRGNVPEAVLTPVPLATYPGFLAAPTFSPDGNQVAFCWNGEKRDNTDIYVKLIGGGPPLRLTTNPAADCQPAWSPDGRSIAFLRALDGGRAAVLLIPALGGPEHKLAETANPFSAPAWSPDGKWLVIVHRSSATEPEALIALSVETGEERKLTTPPALGRDSDPAFSPDGSTLAFNRATSKGPFEFETSGRVYTLSLAPDVMPRGQPKQLTDVRYASGMAWTADGREILFSSGRFLGASLWRIAANGSSGPQPLTSLGDGVGQPAISRQGRRLAYARESGESHLWRLELRRPRGKAGSAESKASLFITSTRSDFDPQFSPDGKRLAFGSGRSSRQGASEIWLCDSNGSNVVQLTSLGAGAGTPRWSPDGARIAFDSDVEGKWSVYVISVSGGKARRLTPGSASNDAPSWSRDGKWIYFASDRTGEDQVWKIPVEGGEAVQVTHRGGTTGFESPDGKFFYYAKGRNATSIWKVLVSGGDETRVVDSLVYINNFALLDSGIYFVSTPPTAGITAYSIRFFDFTTGKVTPISTTEGPARSGFTVSPDGRWITYGQVDRDATELMLVENFR